MKRFLSYFKKHLAGFILFLLFSVIFCVIFFLYELPVESVAYAAVLSAVPALVWLAVDYARFFKKADLLQKLSIHALKPDDLPKALDDVESGYIRLIEELIIQNAKNKSEAATARGELMDYYTLWTHEIKVPLAALKLLAELKKEENTALLEEIFKIERYVDMALGYVKIDGITADLLIKQYSLDSIIKQALKKFSVLFIRKRISLEFSELDTDVLTDEKWLLFVIEQVLSNALKYTGDGGCIKIYMGSGSALCIEDNGVGIEASDLPQIFARCFTGYNGRKDKTSSGLGLYLCKRIMDKLSHTIEIESRAGEGTIVKLGLESAELFAE